MCGFAGLVTKDTNLIKLFEEKSISIEQTIINRGPDCGSIQKGDNWIFLHRLLSINGYTRQPLENDRSVLIYNGEIYNWNNHALEYESDSFYLQNYLDNNIQHIRALDGEFAIAYLDKHENTISLISDPFLTKPLYFIFEKNQFLLFGSYASTLKALIPHSKPQKFPVNTFMSFDCSRVEKIRETPIIEWDFYPRHKNFDRWNEAFSESIKKRIFSYDKKYFIGLSSGYDSGLIASELLRQKKKFTAYVLRGTEDKAILKQRKKICEEALNQVIYLKPTSLQIEQTLAEIEKIDSFFYYDVQNVLRNNMIEDKACLGLSLICKRAHEDGHRIYLSGQGADEIYADYGTQGTPWYGTHQSTIAGNFRNVRLKWANFDSAYQSNYLGKEERISGYWSIEGRYPYLDRNLVQEFLWIDDELRSKTYKSVISERLKSYEFPVAEKKIGFNPFPDVRRARRLKNIMSFFSLGQK